jgi:ABC-type branched-subunit amino acid transport system permease subunit
MFALGFYLVFGLGGIAHLSYGVFALAGGYMISAFYSKFGWAPMVAILISTALVSLLAFIYYKFLLSRTQGVMLNEALISLAIFGSKCAPLNFHKPPKKHLCNNLFH